jgi:iron complex outermembrane receptor protein
MRIRTVPATITGVLLFTALLCAPQIRAEETEPAGEAEGALVMEGEGLTLEADRAGSPVIPETDSYGGRRNVVPAEAIQAQGSLDLLDALRNVPGVMFSKRNAIGTNTGPSLYVRGRGYTHPSLDTSVSFDGVPRFGLIYGQTMADSISVFTADSIEVFKSPQPSSFGAGYAVVNVIPRYQSEQGWSAEGGFSGGSFFTLAENAALGIRKGPFDFYAAQSWASTEGHMVHSGAYQQNYYLNSGFWINAYWNARALLNFVDAETLQAPSADNSKSDILATFKTDTLFSTLTLNNGYDKAAGFIKLYYNYTDFSWLDDNVKVPGDFSRQLLNGWGLRAKETFSFWEGSDLTAGVDLDMNLIENEDHNTLSPSVTTHFPRSTLFSSYVAASQFFSLPGDFYLIPQAGLRGFVHSLWENALSPQGGLTAGRRGLELTAGYSGGIIYPAPGTIQGLINTGNSAAANFKKARPERVHHIEGSVSYTRRWFSLNFSYYHDTGRNRIVAAGTQVPGNVSSAAYFRLQGAEFGGLLNIGKQGPFPGSLELSGGGAWITKISARGEDGVEVRQMPYTPLFSGSAAFAWDFTRNFRVSGDYQVLHKIYGGNLQNSASFSALSESRRLPDIHLLNLRLSCSLAREAWRLSSAEIFLQVNNLLNRRHEYYQGYAMPGLTVTAGGKLAFRGGRPAP